MLKNRKGITAHLSIGALVMLIVVGILFVGISILDPGLGNEITGAITSLRVALFGK